jgi:hypothetical protein
MNIFFLDENPIIAAQSQCDKHVNKMVAETAQILSNCYTLERMAESDCPRTQAGSPRKHSYPHHPCCKWVQKSFDNWQWLVTHGLGLEMERLYRGFQPHFSANFIKWCNKNKPVFTELDFTAPPQAMPEEFKDSCPVIAYRRYYTEYKSKHIDMQWSKTRRPPTWFKVKNNE